jgi:hypothetical protein
MLHTTNLHTKRFIRANHNDKEHDGLTNGRILQYKYQDYLPIYDNVTKFPPTEPIEFTDRGLNADKEKPNLLKAEGVSVTRLTPRIGTEIQGIQLSQLSDVQKDELALLIAERGVVVFRDQDFKDGETLHVHPLIKTALANYQD